MHNLNYLRKSFVNKKVLVTGHTGFKGSWLTFLLNEMGANVMGFALPPSSPINHFDLLCLDKKIKHVTGDIRNAALLANNMNEFQPEFVFQLAMKYYLLIEAKD